MGRIVAVANQKGGVGKTTTAVNLSASLAVAEQKVLLVDLDPQSNATTGLSSQHGKEDCSTYALLIGEIEIESAIQKTELSNLDLICATPDLAALETEIASEENRSLRLRDALQSIQDKYDFIVIDCPPSLGLLTINALTAADLVVVPLQCEYYALEGLSQLVHTVGRVQSSLNPNLKIHGVLLTMFDRRNNLANEVSQEVRQHFPVYETVISRNVRLAEAPSHGKPVILYDSSSRGAYQYLNLAREILESLSELRNTA